MAEIYITLDHDVAIFFELVGDMVEWLDARNGVYSLSGVQKHGVRLFEKLPNTVLFDIQDEKLAMEFKLRFS